MQLYIDSNIYLEYFRENSAERLTPLKELLKLLKKEEVVLLLPSQTRQEYFRNRRKIAEITRLSLIRQSNISSFIPAVLDKGNKEVKDVLSKKKDLITSYKKLIKKYDKEVEKEKTDADLLINELFLKFAKVIKETDEIIASAYRRYMKGNPPRKNDHSYGDALIWETLLKEGANDDLVLITKDGDFIEKHKGKPKINQFLFVEWRIKTKKKKKVILYKSLAEFVNTFTKKEILKKEIIEKENSSVFNASITKSLSYNTQGTPTISASNCRISDTTSQTITKITRNGLIAEADLDSDPLRISACQNYDSLGKICSFCGNIYHYEQEYCFNCGIKL